MLTISGVKSSKRIWTLRTMTTTLSGTLAVGLMLEAWKHSNEMFFYWATRCMSQTTRANLDSTLKSLGDIEFNNVTNDAVQVIRQELPPLFGKAVGRQNEFAYGLAQKDQFGLINISVAYGYRERRWGVYQGDFIAGKWPHAKKCRIYGDTFFFVTTEY